MPVIPATQKEEIRRIIVQSRPALGKQFVRPYLEKKITKNGVVAQVIRTSA
jgi:hypothetical protein